MSTSAVIGMYNPSDKSVSFISCHFGGHPCEMGETLKKHYMSREKVEALINLGNLSELREEIGVKHDFDYDRTLRKQFGFDMEYAPEAVKEQKAKLDKMCLAYGRDREEIYTEPQRIACLKHFLQLDIGQVFSYLFKDRKWSQYMVCKGLGKYNAYSWKLIPSTDRVTNTIT